MPPKKPSEKIAPAKNAPRRFGLALDRGDFEQLREEFDRINQVEQSAELAATGLRLF